MGDKTPIRVCREGNVDLDYGIFKNVLHVLKYIHEYPLYIPYYTLRYIGSELSSLWI
jgi:hypothetical protein